MDDEKLAAVAAGLRNHTMEARDLAVEQAVGLGPAGEALLVQALAGATGWFRVVLAAALGDATGDAGPDALRRQLGVTGPGSRDLRCAALLALAKRGGAAANEALTGALRDGDQVVRDYAVLGLAKAGDDRAWDEVLAWLVTLLKKPGRQPSLQGPESQYAIGYLVRHAPAGSARLARLVTTLRERWAGLDSSEQSWILRHLPAAAPDGPATTELPAPNPSLLLEVMRSPLFGRAVC